MSGLEILGAVATSIALVEAVKGTLRAVDFLRQNSAILMIECFIMQAQQQTDPTMPAQRLLGPTEHPLVSLAVEELEDILNELNQIVEKYSNYRKANDPKRYIDKMKWFSEATKIDELRERSQAIKSNLHMAITFRVSSMVDHGNIRQEVLFHRVTQQLTSQHINQALLGVPETSSSAYSRSVVAQKHCNRGVEDSGVVHSPSLSRTETVGRSMPLTTVTRQEESFVNVTAIQSQSTRMCSLSCQCRCHRKREYTGGAWAKSLLGSWLVRYESLGNTCQGRCAPNPGVKFEYQLPKWLWAGLVSVEVCQNPTFNLALRPCRVLQSNNDIYYMIDHPSILQEHIREGYRYFPDDKNESGDTLLERAIHNRSWETVRILLGLWESLLAQQGLPRTVGCYFRLMYINSEPQSDSMGLVMEKFSSYVPEWDEIYSNDIHLEAMYPERTREGMSKALREQPWAIDDWDDVGYSPIHYAVVEGNLKALDLLIKAKANINQHCCSGHTPLIYATLHSLERVTARLLESRECRMNVNYTTTGGINALHFAVQKDSLIIVRMLLAAGATAKRHTNSEPILHVFSFYTRSSQDDTDEMLHALLMHGANIEEKSDDGDTPVMTAVQRKNILALRSLVSAGASLTAISSKNHNILHFAAYNPDAEMINYIGKHNLAGVELEQRSTDDCNPLSMLHASWNRPSWRITDSYPRPSLAEMEVFITFYFGLLIPDLRRHMSTIDNLLQAVKDRDVTTATEILDQLIERKVRCNQTDLVGWYRGLKGYVVDGGWDYLEDVLKDEYDETNEKIGRAAVARGKTINDPEMEEFF
ncbi:hypothetical protein HYE67_004087 [Fusarium culmorum]|uniref:Uncharacterized protein n=1 Tax=Fusarium culmorum TaxID=5516 RepID=A0A7S8HU98_FUSCU|nr:hypothetical protein HYE67_004087 [Fusarium culmorum]